MKLFRLPVALAASLALVSAPALAAPANPAASLSVAKSARAGSPAKGERLNSGGYVGVVAAVLVIALVAVLAFNNDNDNDSDSN